MGLVSLAEYAIKHGKALRSVRQKAAAGGFSTAVKIGRNWVINEEEPYSDLRIKSGQYVDARKNAKAQK
jgi:DNA (cytosine-5)-methyltransferase 1